VYICCVCVFSKEGTGLNRRSRGGNICVYMLCLCVFEGRDRVEPEE